MLKAIKIQQLIDKRSAHYEKKFKKQNCISSNGDNYITSAAKETYVRAASNGIGFTLNFEGDGEVVTASAYKNQNNKVKVYNQWSPCDIYVQVTDTKGKFLNRGGSYVLVGRGQEVGIPVSSSAVNKNIRLQISPASAKACGICGLWNPNEVRLNIK